MTVIIVSTLVRVHLPKTPSSASDLRFIRTSSLSWAMFFFAVAPTAAFSLFARCSASSQSSVHLSWMPSSATCAAYLSVSSSSGIVSQSEAAAHTSARIDDCIAPSSFASECSICPPISAFAVSSTCSPSAETSETMRELSFLSNATRVTPAKTDWRCGWIASGFEPCERISSRHASATKKKRGKMVRFWSR